MTDPHPGDEDVVRSWIARYDARAEQRWNDLVASLRERFGREITIEAILFLMGVQTRGRGFEPKIHRDVKQDVIMEGTFVAFEAIGFYDRVGMESDGAWIWERKVAVPAALDVSDQEALLKVAILEYFAAAEADT